jgi:hypothetical protein
MGLFVQQPLPQLLWLQLPHCYCWVHCNRQHKLR